MANGILGSIIGIVVGLAVIVTLVGVLGKYKENFKLSKGKISYSCTDPDTGTCVVEPVVSGTGPGISLADCQSQCKPFVPDGLVRCNSNADCKSGETCLVGDGSLGYCATAQPVSISYKQARPQNGSCLLATNAKTGYVSIDNKNNIVPLLATGSKMFDDTSNWLYDPTFHQIYNPSKKCFLQSTGPGDGPSVTQCTGKPIFEQKMDLSLNTPTNHQTGVVYNHRGSPNYWCLSDQGNAGTSTNFNFCNPQDAGCSNVGLNAIAQC